jgi:hypothetical protein
VVAIVGFVLAFAAGIGIELAARRPGAKIPSFGMMCAWAMRYKVKGMPVGRLGLLLVWWWLGWHFLDRSGGMPH